ncbi:DUF1330 domain-containing protein [Salinarimonas soli]|uniref:DUF1330 domain-containing protein n=1 Tax=Salinarimonas soli TaxID=1638099 RepID=A0A5B2VV86_9HYPH|nr:DUF1330 domain-containing protein [Salinarimonas soli]KAA2242136.1 DUF1330 domain-containing protein [Salinarimonas soli]
MPAYAVAHLRQVDFGPDIVAYLQRIDATLDPYGGRFVVHGGPVEVIEGGFSADLIMIEFPDRENARAWYASPEYQAILRLRTDHSTGDVFLVEGVPQGYRGVDILKKLPHATA